MIRLSLAALCAAVALGLASCASDPVYDAATVDRLLSNPDGLTTEDYAVMLDQLVATHEMLKDGENLPEEELEHLITVNSDMNFILVEALNDNRLDSSTAADFEEWLSENQ